MITAFMGLKVFCSLSLAESEVRESMLLISRALPALMSCKSELMWAASLSARYVASSRLSVLRL